VRDSDVTLWFGNVGSPGYRCTRTAAKDFDRPFIENPSTDQMVEIFDTYETVNIAGNRKSTNPPVVGLVRDAFSVLKA
jgi:hypothetical protein